MPIDLPGFVSVPNTAPERGKNSLSASPGHIEVKILGPDGQTIGTIRIKPSSVCWKPEGQPTFFKVPIKLFAQWISDAKTGAKRVNQ